MVNVAVCDDERAFAVSMKRIVAAYFAEHCIEACIDVFYSGNDFVDLQMDMARYQIVFLDINMDGLDGIKTAQALRNLSERASVIFVTAFIDYTLEGYRVEALRYILKSDVNFKDAVYEGLNAACKRLNYETRLVEIPFFEGAKKVSKDKIVYVESNLHKVIFHILENELSSYTMYGKITEVNDYLNTKKMVRIHQSYILNMDFCKRLFYNRAVLKNGKVLPVSKTYSKEVREFFVLFKGEI